MELNAKLLEKFEEVAISATFKKREFVVEYAENPKYPEFIKFELIQDKCDLLNNFDVGQTINIHFNIKGRKWVNAKQETVYFNSLQAWKLLDPANQQNITNSTQGVEIPPLDAYSSDEVTGEEY